MTFHAGTSIICVLLALTGAF